MDVWIEFKNASKFQAEGLFRNFFPVEPPPPAKGEGEDEGEGEGEEPPIEPSPEMELLEGQDHDPKPLDEKSLDRLAKLFADSLPDEGFSVADLQGYLLKNKTRPRAAANEAAQWAVEERARKEKMKKEKEEKEKKEREEEEKREKEEEENAEKEGENGENGSENDENQEPQPVEVVVIPVPPEDDSSSEDDVP
jgi:mitochondrial chaperone BCS1